MLSPEASAEPGRWHTERAEYLRGIMDSMNDPLVEKLVVKSSSQIGKTEILNNICGYFIEQDPSPILIVMPTLELGKSWSQDRLSPMLRDTKCLKGLVKDSNQKESGNTILHKVFPGGHLTVVGSNSPSGLASRPIRILLCDEIDRYDISREGDVIALAEKRTSNFWNRKIALFSTPTDQDTSRIDAAFQETDQRYFWVPCIYCGEYQLLDFDQVKWEKEYEQHRPDTAHYECIHCKSHWSDVERHRSVRKGEWRASAPFHGQAGFFINEMYSPWSPMQKMVRDFLQAKKSTETLKTWVNTVRGECWVEQGEKIDQHTLISRIEDYVKVPDGVLVLTAGVDIQGNRAECEIVGWGLNEESWSIDYRVIEGDPAQNLLWEDLENLLLTQFQTLSGINLNINCACIDTGYHTKRVYDFVKSRESRRVFAVKGSNLIGDPLTGRPSTSNARGVQVFRVGTDTAKTLLFHRLQIQEPGPGYCHFPNRYDEEYFYQLTAEKLVTRMRNGVAYRAWKQLRPRNEALDCRVYAMAALDVLKPNFQILSQKQDITKKEMGITPQQPTVEAIVPQQPALNFRQRMSLTHKRGSSGWMKL